MSKISKAMERADREERRGQDAGGPAAGGDVHDGPRQAEESGVVTPTARRAPVRMARAAELPENIEEYHSLVSEVYIALPDLRSRVIMVVSAVDGEGTSTVAREFAHCVAATNEIDTLLIDGNLRRPQHHKVLCHLAVGEVDRRPP